MWSTRQTRQGLPPPCKLPQPRGCLPSHSLGRAVAAGSAAGQPACAWAALQSKQPAAPSQAISVHGSKLRWADACRQGACQQQHERDKGAALGKTLCFCCVQQAGVQLCEGHRRKKTSQTAGHCARTS